MARKSFLLLSRLVKPDDWVTLLILVMQSALGARYVYPIHSNHMINLLKTCF